MHAYIHTYIHAYIHTYIHKYIHTYVRTYVRTYILRMGIHPQYNQYPQVNSRIISGQGARIMLLLWLKTPNCRSTVKQCNAEARLHLTIETIEHHTTSKDQQ